MFNDVMNHEHQVQNICKVAFSHIRNLSKIRKCLTQKDTETLVHDFVTSKLNNCNSLLAELTQYLLDKTQRVQNAATRLLSCTPKYDRITPVLKGWFTLATESEAESEFRSARNVTIQSKSKIGIGSGVRSSTESESEGSEEFLFLTIPLLFLSLPIQ